MSLEHQERLSGAPRGEGNPAVASVHHPLDDAGRAAALLAPPPRLPRRVLYLAAAVICTLGIGGSVVDSLVATPSGPAATPSPTITIPAPTPRAAGLSAYLGLTILRPRLAPAFALVDQHAGQVTSTSVRGSVVVLSFFDARCTGICPVLESELRAAALSLGPDAHKVIFLTVNTSPYDTSLKDAARISTTSGLGAFDWHFLTAPLATLNRVWSSYGVSVEVATNTGRSAYTQVLYIFDTAGRLRYKMTPFANEARSTGADSLPSPDVVRFGRGIATYSERLLNS